MLKWIEIKQDKNYERGKTLQNKEEGMEKRKYEKIEH